MWQSEYITNWPVKISRWSDLRLGLQVLDQQTEELEPVSPGLDKGLFVILRGFIFTFHNYYPMDKILDRTMDSVLVDSIGYSWI